MSPELEQHLEEQFPLVFPNKLDMAIGDGWFDIMEVLLDNIQSYIHQAETRRDWTINWNKLVNDPSNDWSESPFVKREERSVPELIDQVVAVQVKEKFGGLRFYYTGGDDYIRGLVSMAESMSIITCEECGLPGKIRKGKWVKALCADHAIKSGYADD